MKWTKPASVFFFVALGGWSYAQPNAIDVTLAWSRALPAVVKNGAAYVSLINHDEAVDYLIGASTPIANRVEIHTQVIEEGVMKMRRIDTVALHSEVTTQLEPGGQHFMLIGLTEPLVEGRTFPMTLLFERAPPLDVVVSIEKFNTETATAVHDHKAHAEHGHKTNEAAGVE